jgi:HAE1 family hydrophobic/amphiphilic exporter-1
VQRLAEICIARPIFASMLVLALVVVGAVSWMRLGVDRFPVVELPSVTVRTTLPGASPEEVEIQVSQRIEEAVNTVAGIQELRSISGNGSSIVIVTFELDRDIDTAAQDIRDRVATVLRNLPDDAEPPLISKFDNESSPILRVALSGDRSIKELTELADKVVKLRIERSSGVGEVTIEGGLERTINVWIDADRLAAYRLPITAVRDAIVRQNADAPGGNVTGQARELSLRTLGRLPDAAAFNELVVATVGGAPVRIRDLGRAEDGTREERSISRLNGRPTVVLEVRRQAGANTVAAIESTKANLAQAMSVLPPDVKADILQDQSGYIYAALHEINVHLVLGSILASLVVLAFMRSWASTAIAAVAIPASVITTSP